MPELRPITDPADPALAPFADRDSKELFVCEGRFVINRLLANPRFRTRAILTEEGRHIDLFDAAPLDAELLTAPTEVISDLLGFAFHRGALALAERPAPEPLATALPTDSPLIIACPNVADPSNLGSIVRNAAAFGASAIVMGRKGADPWSRIAIRTASGTCFQVPILQTPTLLEDLRSLAETSEVLGAGLEGANQCWLADYRPKPGKPKIILFGNEGTGLQSRYQDLCHTTLTIPLADGIDSLNVAASSAVILHALTGNNGSNLPTF